MLVAHLVESVASQQQVSEAEIGRRLGVDRARLWQWKTYRRRMPTRAVYELATMAGVSAANAVGQYALEWEGVRQRVSS